MLYGIWVYYNVNMFENIPIFNISKYTKRFSKYQAMNKSSRIKKQSKLAIIYVVVNIKVLNTKASHKTFTFLEFLFPKSFNNKKPVIFAEIVRKTIPGGLYSTLN